MQRQLNTVLVGYFGWKFGQQHPITRWKVKRVISPPQRALDLHQVEQLLSTFSRGASDNSLQNRKYWNVDLEHPLGVRNLAIVWLLLDCGFRATEICELEIQKLDLEARQVTGRVKFGRWRTATFTKRTADALKDWLAIREEYVEKPAEGRLFVGLLSSHRGRPLQSSALRIIMRKLGRLSGLGPLSPHDFRRTFATNLMRNGAPLQAIQQAGGWQDASMVLHYTRSIRASEAVPYLAGNTIPALASETA